MITTVTALRSPGLPSKEYYKDAELVAKYGRVIGEVLESLLEKASQDESSLDMASFLHPGTNSAELVEELLDFEAKLAAATPDTEDAEDVTKYYNPKTTAEVSELLPQLSIPSIMENFAPTGCSPKKLIVGSPSYLQSLSTALEETSFKALKAYLVWKTVQAYASKIEDDAVKPLKVFDNELSGKDANAVEDRWRTCIRSSDNSLGKP